MTVEKERDRQTNRKTTDERKRKRQRAQYLTMAMALTDAKACMEGHLGTYIMYGKTFWHIQQIDDPAMTQLKEKHF